MKIFNLVFFILFILFGALQYNDPDPYIWIPIYGYAASICWLAFRRRYYKIASLVGIIAYLFYAIYLLFTKNGVLDWATKHGAENIASSMKATKPWIENTREFFGLLILIVVLSIDFVYASKQQRRLTV